jgi:hypothetical protein
LYSRENKRSSYEVQNDKVRKLNDRILENMKMYKDAVLIPSVQKIQDSIDKEEKYSPFHHNIDQSTITITE